MRLTVKVFLLTVPRRGFFCGSFLLFVFRVWRVFLSIHCSLVVTCWETADLLDLLCVMFYCVSVTFPCGVLGQVWCLIVPSPDLCLLSYFQSNLNIIWWIESYIRAFVLMNLLNSLRKRDKMFGRPSILPLFLNSFNKFNKAWALM